MWDEQSTDSHVFFLGLSAWEFRTHIYLRMKRFTLLLTVLLMAGVFSVLFGQESPLEWRQYTTTGYIYDIQHDRNTYRCPETDFRNYLTDIARTNVARQIHVRITDYASLNKVSINGISSTSYTASTRFSTDLNIKLVETKSCYNSFTGDGFSIAYINKSKAASVYVKDIRVIFNRINNAIAVANTYVSTGFKTKARSELENVENEFDRLEEPFFWLAVFDCPESELNGLLSESITLEQTLARRLAELQHGINVYVQCSADMFGQPYPQLQGDVKERLSAIGCTFCNDVHNADWIVKIRAAAEEHNCVSVGGNSAYFSYIHANLSIIKTITGQNIYEEEISEKGGHTHNHNQAARDGYKRIAEQISEILTKYIK